MEIEFREGLLFTDITIQFNGLTKVINNVVIDTGASHTLISQDEVDEIGIRVAFQEGKSGDTFNQLSVEATVTIIEAKP